VNQPLGIDKIHLYLPISDVTIEPHYAAKVHNSENAATQIPNSHQQLFWNGERYVTGAFATGHTDDYQVSIAPDPNGGCARCMVQWSGRAFAGSNEVPLDYDSLFDVASRVEAELSKAGLHFPMDKARLTRIDLAKNIELSHPVASYTPVFGALRGRKSMNKQDFGGTGFLMGNTQRQVCFYDKGAEMNAKGLDLAECPINTLRPECRLMRGRAVQAALGVETLPDLRRGWEKIPGAYVHSMEQDVFRAKMEKKIGAHLDYYQEAKFIMDSEFTRKWQAFKGDVGEMMLVRDLGLEHAKQFAVFELVDDFDSPTGKRQIQRIHGDLERAALAIKMCDTAPEKTPIQELYRELKKRVIG
jgi:hypothetical protein